MRTCRRRRHESHTSEKVSFESWQAAAHASTRAPTMRAVLAATSKHTQARTSEYPTPSSNSLGQRFATSTTALCARDVCETRKPGKRNKVNTAYSSVKRVPEMSNPRKFEMLGCVVMSLYVPSNVMLKHPPMSTLCARWVRQTMPHQHRQYHPHL